MDYTNKVLFFVLLTNLSMDVVKSLVDSKASENFHVWEMAAIARINIRDKYNASSNLDKLFLNETVFS